MKLKLSMLLATVGCVATVLTAAPAASAAPQTGLTLPATCTNVATGTAADCTLQLVGFTTQGGTLAAILQLTNDATGQITRIVVPITQQQGGTCTILDLTIQPIDLFLLGLHLHTDTIHLELTAQRGTLLGDLLCGLFFGPSPLQQLVGALNTALRQGTITA
jgi:hypothetical protein